MLLIIILNDFSDAKNDPINSIF